MGVCNTLWFATLLLFEEGVAPEAFYQYWHAPRRHQMQQAHGLAFYGHGGPFQRHYPSEGIRCAHLLSEARRKSNHVHRASGSAVAADLPAAYSAPSEHAERQCLRRGRQMHRLRWEGAFYVGRHLLLAASHH